jgi:MFS transporter, PAT family, beta-lactamase induction signal transducer AmpG
VQDGSKIGGYRQLLWNRRLLLCVALGFSSGLPLYVTWTLLQAWLHREGVSLGDIGLFNLTGLPYTWKFLWAPLLDRYPLPFLGRRRGWMLCTQLALVVSIAGLGWLDAAGSPASVAALALLVAFFSATQDVVLNAYQREILPDRELGLGTALHVNAYRLAQLVPGSLALILADHLPWPPVFASVAAFMLVGILASLFGSEGKYPAPPPATLHEAVVGPFREFFARQDRWAAVLVLSFMLLYKIGDSMAAALVTPFYLELGFTLTEVGVVAKGAGVPATVAGLFVGGFVITRIGINRALWVFGVGQIVSTLGLGGRERRHRVSDRGHRLRPVFRALRGARHSRPVLVVQGRAVVCHARRAAQHRAGGARLSSRRVSPARSAPQAPAARSEPGRDRPQAAATSSR